jgi:hypothetical protein
LGVEADFASNATDGKTSLIVPGIDRQVDATKQAK